MKSKIKPQFTTSEREVYRFNMFKSCETFKKKKKIWSWHTRKTFCRRFSCGGNYFLTSFLPSNTSSLSQDKSLHNYEHKARQSSTITVTLTIIQICVKANPWLKVHFTTLSGLLRKTVNKRIIQTWQDKTVGLPYVAERLAAVLKLQELGTYHKLFHSLRSLLVHPEDRNLDERPNELKRQTTSAVCQNHATTGHSRD